MVKQEELTECIFVDKPKECQGGCIDVRALKCLENHRHLVLTDKGKATVVRVATEEASHQRRYKTKSGQEQRPR